MMQILMTRLWRTLALLVSATAAQAATVTVQLSGGGQTLPGTPSAQGVLPVTVLPELTRYTLTVDGLVLTGWQLDSRFGVQLSATGEPGNSQGSGRFFDPAGDDAIDFSFEGLRQDDLLALVYELTYDITGGRGRFAGADGSGFETVRIARDFSFSGQGRLNLTVPEPGAAWLALLGLLVAAAGRRRGPGRRAPQARSQVFVRGPGSGLPPASPSHGMP